MIEFWEEMHDGGVLWHFRGTVYGDFLLDPNDLVKGRVDEYGIVYVGNAGIITDPITVQDENGRETTFSDYTDNREIVAAVRRLFKRINTPEAQLIGRT